MTDSVDTSMYSAEAEQSVLGGLLIDNQAWDRCSDLVSEKDFYSLDHRKIFRAISRLLEGSKVADLVTVSEFLESHDELQKVGGLAYLVSLSRNTPSTANITHYANIVRERSLLRGLTRATAEIAEAVDKREGRSAKELLDLAQAKVMALSETAARGLGGPQHVATVLDDVINHIDELANRPTQTDVTGLSTGFNDLDKLTTGFQPGELIIIAARPAMGKTAFALNITEHVALTRGGKALFFSLEMANNQLGIRLLASVSQLNQQRVKIARLYDKEWPKLIHAAEQLRGAQIYLDEEGAMSANDLRARARRLHRECGGLDVILVDYLQLMQGSGRSDNRALELSEISRALKLLAKELQIPVIALSQLNRALEQRPNKRPIMSDLRDSGGIEQDADIILFIYRDEVYNEDSPDKGIAEIIIGKQRNGPTCTVHTVFRGELTRFESRDWHEPVPSVVERNERRAKRAGSSGAGSFRGKNSVDNDVN